MGDGVGGYVGVGGKIEELLLVRDNGDDNNDRDMLWASEDDQEDAIRAECGVKNN